MENFDENYEDEFDDDFTLSEKLLNKELLLKEAFYNSYLLITKQAEFDKLFEDTKVVVIAHDTESDIDKDVIDNVISYYEDEEDYEKCAELLKISKSLS